MSIQKSCGNNLAAEFIKFSRTLIANLKYELVVPAKWGKKIKM